MFLSIHIPVTVTSWESLVADIPSDEVGDVDLVRVLAVMEDSNTFMMNRQLSQRLMLQDALGDGSVLIDLIMEATTGVKVPQAFLCIHYYTVLFTTLYHHPSPPH